MLLVCYEGTIPAPDNLRSLGNAHIAQLGRMLGLAVALVGEADALSQRWWHGEDQPPVAAADAACAREIFAE